MPVLAIAVGCTPIVFRLANRFPRPAYGICQNNKVPIALLRLLIYFLLVCGKFIKPAQARLGHICTYPIFLMLLFQKDSGSSDVNCRNIHWEWETFHCKSYIKLVISSRCASLH